jgi:hypothetical protein
MPMRGSVDGNGRILHAILASFMNQAAQIMSTGHVSVLLVIIPGKQLL